ncbi:MAG: cytochrome c oxidase subunit II [Anaerolineae bacterium]|nr:cytochrome c oxidase subunit II [Anaerolineae bacterium]
MKYARHFAIVAVLVVVGAIGTYLLLDAIYALPPAASEEAVAIDGLFRGHFILISFLFALVLVFILYSVVVFRRRPEDPEDVEGDHFHGHTGLEIAWTIFPLVVVIVFGVWGARLLTDIIRPAEEEMTVQVSGQQWSWRFTYPEHGDFTTDELVLPVGQPVRLELTSLDVLHSFWVPEFRVKQDLVPGQVHELRITPTEEGEYKTRCAEICGTSHAYMISDVRIVSATAFDDWIQESTTSIVELEPAERGQLWAQQFGCTGCHSADGTALAGPTWLGLYNSEIQLASGETVVADEDYIINSILAPNDQIHSGFSPNIMPQNFEELFAAEEEKYDGEVSILDDLVAYILTLSE